jgi:hypothetical protein
MLGTRTVHSAPVKISKFGCIHTKISVEGDVKVAAGLATRPAYAAETVAFPFRG